MFAAWRLRGDGCCGLGAGELLLSDASWEAIVGGIRSSFTLGTVLTGLIG